MKEKEEVREGEADEKKGKKKPPFMKKKGKKDTEIIPGGEGSEGVTKMNDPRKKGAPSLDDENNDACNKKMDKKGGKDCGCTHKNDALTPQEYIAACEMGIQDRSRIYIRARLDTAEQVRNDLAKTGGTGKKCGNSYIPKSANCTVGSNEQLKKNAMKAKAAIDKPKSKPRGGSGPRLRDLQGFGTKKANARAQFYNGTSGSLKGIGNKVKRVAEFAANAGAGYQLYSASNSFSKGRIGEGAQKFLNASALSSVASGSRAQRQGNTALARDFNRQAGQLITAKVGVGALQVAQRGGINGRAVRNSFVRNRARVSNAAFGVEQRMRGFRKYNPDSVWADGFGKTDAESALSANAMNLATDQYSNEKRKRNAQGQPRNIIYANTFNT